MDKKGLDDMIKNLTEIPGILDKELYHNSVVLIPLVFIGGEYHLLFQMRNFNIRQGGEVSFPGGMYDPTEDESLEATAIRETYEEMGIPKDKIKIIGRLDTMVAPMGITIDSFVSLVDIGGTDELIINKNEVEYAFTVPVSHFENSQPEKYNTRVMIESSYMDEEGRKVTLLPAEELGLPELYYKSWGRRNYEILIYRYKNEMIWGMTARLVYEVVKKLKR
ncbi:putative nudix hydrolase NudL [Oxobacter pfennigii]|uniref:Putative nudix hydrolase NudL n=1 Tax=Oxobacter pfennigii TaxID=36849 RepID=A0A0P8YV88_9CLOT|nr:CoA pyrophosphatase [Oxobacter pfennigii]KPU43621.1 putative nudix hydrolase NudL [Oxobacter pfennigii]